MGVVYVHYPHHISLLTNVKAGLSEVQVTIVVVEDWEQEATVEPPNKGHFGNGSFVLCSEVVPISGSIWVDNQ